MMNFLGRISIVAKIILVSTFLAAIFFGISFGYTIINIRSDLTESTRKILETEVVNEKDKIETFITQVRATILSLSGTPPFQGIIRAQANDGFDELENSTLEQWDTRLAAIFIAQMESTRIYDQLRYIDENGQEIVRVDYDNGIAERVGDDLLQNKRDRSYFVEASSLEQGQIYVSNTELNKEGNPPVLSDPHKPVIRLAVPIFDEVSGGKKGILIANVLLDKLIAKNYLVSHVSSNVYITNTEGYYFVHPDQEKEWGSENDLGHGANYFKEFPDIRGSDLEADSGSFFSGSDIFVYARVLPDSLSESREWIIFERTPTAVIFSHINTIVRNALLVAVGVFVILFFMLLLGVRQLLNPLKELAVAAGEIGRGNLEQNVVVSSRDEVGQLAKTFNTMSARLKESYASLEEKVRNRTRQLEIEKDKLGALSSRLELATQSAKIGIWDWDVVKNVLVWDDQMYKLYGIRKEDFGGAYEAWQKGVHPDDLKRGDEEIQLALKDEKPFNTTFRVIWPDKSIHDIRAFAIVKRDESDKPLRMIGVNWDITHEKEIDRAKTEFVSLASHQLRTPLSAINWYAEILMAGDAGELSDEQKQYLGEIYQGNQRMVDLVDALLNTSRIDLGAFAIDPEPTSFIEVADSVIKELTPLIEQKKQKLTKQYDEGLPATVSADPKLVRIVFQNLLSNAVKYTPDEGTVTLEMSKQDLDVLIKVSDTGYGIPKEQQNKIFQKLFRADNIREKETEGTGLGLYIVKAIVEESGGSIRFESEEAKGTTFFVTIPLSGMKRKGGTKGLSVDGSAQKAT